MDIKIGQVWEDRTHYFVVHTIATLVGSEAEMVVWENWAENHTRNVKFVEPIGDFRLRVSGMRSYDSDHDAMLAGLSGEWLSDE